MEVVVLIRNATLALAVLTGVAAASAQPTAPTKPKALDPANFDTSAKPCEDFYAYANGNWLKSHTIPADRARYGSFEEVSDRNREVLRKILEETSAKSDWPKGSLEQKVGDFYAAGMDEAAIERAGTKPLAPLFAAIDKLKAPGDLPAVLAELHARGLEAGFNFRVAQDARESTRYIGILNQGGLGLPDRDYYTKDDPKSKNLREAYRTHVAKIFELSGDSPEKAKASADVVMALETKLAEPSLTRVENRDPQKTYNMRTLAALASEAPGFEFALFFTDLGASYSSEVNVRQQPLRVEVVDAERQVHRPFPRPSPWRRDRGEMRWRPSEVDLGGGRAADSLMRAEVRVVDEADLDLLHQVFGRQRSQQAQAQRVLQRPPQAFDQGD